MASVSSVLAGPSLVLNRAPAQAAAPAGLFYLDGLRVAGMVAVVLLHVSLGLIHYRALSPSDLTLCLAVNALTWWAVPVFVMISGALLLEPARWTTVGDFYYRRLARIGWPLMFWCALYMAWPLVFAKAGANRYPDMQEARGWAGLWLGEPYYHLHFLFIVAGLYLVTPLLVMAVRRWGGPFAWVAMIGGFILAAATTWAMARANLRPNLFVRFLPFLPYFLAGYCLKNCVLSRRAVAVALVVAVAMVFAEVQLLAWAHEQWTWISHEKAVAHYLSPPVIVLALVLFLLARTLGNSGTADPVWRQRCQGLAATSFGVYLVHPLILDLLARMTHDGARLASPTLIEIAAGTAVTLVLSYGLTRMLQQVPLLRRVVG